MDGPSPLSPLASTRPPRLVVVGAAAGIGRWMGDHLFSGLPWSDTLLIDASDSIVRLDHPYPQGARLLQLVNPGDAPTTIGQLTDALVVVAVPLTHLAEVATWLTPLLGAGCVVIDTSHDRARAEATWGTVVTLGLHPLFGLSDQSAAGQTFVLCPPLGETPPQWLLDVVEGPGGTVNVLNGARHDEVMQVVQNATHQALLAFADVVGRSGLDLEEDLWANRTPVFELLMALAVRVLQPGQDAGTASIQLAHGAQQQTDALHEALGRLRDARTGGESSVVTHLAALREPFSGGLFAKISQAGTLATSAVQASRARIADHRRAGELVGIRTIGSDKLHVGRIVATTPTSFTLENLLVGIPGRSALLVDGTATENARRSGITGRIKQTEFRLGRVEVLSPAELEANLDTWLATVTRGCKVLIPESISGASAVRVVAGITQVVGASLVTEEVRIGQRECVVRYEARIDRDLDEIERTIQQRVDETFVWPDGVVLPLTRQARTIGFLGPAGTFSDVGARQLARLVNSADAVRAEFADFGSLVEAVAQGSIDLAVLPITNSSSGLVDLAAEVLSRADNSVVAGGVVDVPVRIDAYVAPGNDLVEGSVAYTHPQVFRQCSTFVAAMKFQQVICASTAEACRRVADTQHGVALAATGMQADFGLVTARSSVGNLAGALTRFLVLGMQSMFDEPARADALLRTVWIIEPEMAGRLPLTTEPRYDEVLRGPSGRTLLISTDASRVPAGTPGARLVATFPWSPRTPLVVVG